MICRLRLFLGVLRPIGLKAGYEPGLRQKCRVGLLGGCWRDGGGG